MANLSLSRRRILGLLGLSTVATALAACGGSPAATPQAQPTTAPKAVPTTAPQPSSAPTTAPQPTAVPTAAAAAQPTAKPAPQATTSTSGKPSGSVTWWSGAEYTMQDHQKEFVDAYQKNSPGVKLNLQIIPEPDEDKKLMPSIAAGGGPDVFIQAYVPKLSRPSICVDINPYVSAEKIDLSQWNHDALAVNGITDDGKLLGLPRDQWGIEGRYYSKDLFAKFNVPEPKLGWTWSDLLAIAPKLSDKKNRYYGVAVDVPVPAPEFGFLPVTTDGKSVVNLFDSPQAINAFKVWRQLYQYSPTLDQQNTEFNDIQGGGAGPIGAYMSKRTAIAALDPGTYTEIDKANIKWGYINPPWPDNPADRHLPSLSYVLWSINKNTKNPDGSWDFLKWLSSKDGGTKLLAAAGFLVPFKENLTAAGYPKAVLDVQFYDYPSDWKAPIAGMYGIPCFREAGIKEWEAATTQVLSSPESQITQIVKDHAKKAQQADEACFAKANA